MNPNRRGISLGTKKLHFDNSDMTNIINEIESIKNRLDNIERILDKLNNFENRISKIENKLGIKINECNKENKLSNYINYIKINDLGYECFLPKEIENDNEKINSLIKEKAYNNYLPNNEDCENETVGNFFYSIGGISRVSQKMANKLFIELFQEYKNYLRLNKIWLSFNHENDRRNFSIWVKKCLKGNECYEYLSNSNIKEINEYFYEKDKETNDFLFLIFKKLIGLYLKCRLSIPLVETSYATDNCNYEPNLMLDIINKNPKRKKVNFCYLPEMKSNGKTLSKYYVFNYIEGKTYQKKGKIFENYKDNHYPKLYEFPDFKNFKISFINYNLIIKPTICSELNPEYILYKNSDKNYVMTKDGIFRINPNEIQFKFAIQIKYANNLEFKKSFNLTKN